MASAKRLVLFESPEGRESRAASVAHLLVHGGKVKDSGLERFVAALDEARVSWRADEEEEQAWLQCSACGSWRRGVCGLGAAQLGSFTCAQNRWRPQQASCQAPQEEKLEDEDWEGQEGQEGEAGAVGRGGGAGAAGGVVGGSASGSAGGSGAGGGGSSSNSSTVLRAGAASSTEYYLGETEAEDEE